MRRAYRPALAAAAVGTLIFVGACSPQRQPGTDVKPPESTSGASASQYGYTAIDAAQQLQKYLDRDDPEGYVSVETDRDSLLLYWYGDQPKSLMATIKDIRAKGVAVNIRVSPYSLTQLESTRRKVNRDASRWSSGGFEVVDTAIAPDGSALLVYVNDSADVAAARVFANAQYGSAVRVLTVTEGGL